MPTLNIFSPTSYFDVPEFFTRNAWLYNLLYGESPPAFDRNITVAWASCGAVPLSAYHLQLSQPFTNHQVLMHLPDVNPYPGRFSCQ